MTERHPFLHFQATKMLQTAEGPRLLDIHCQLAEGHLLAIYGPSGAGKTTLLRILSGLTDVSSGHITAGEETWLDTRRKIDLPAQRRSIGFVFQDFALFPHLTVRQQLEFALPAAPIKKDLHFVSEILALMELEGLQHQRPAHLSGGQQQRVALARAIARRPRLLLLDEPLSALDDAMRFKLQDYLLNAHRRYGLTTLLVSHSLSEIFRLSDQVIILEKGRIVRQGSPASLFQPANHPPSPGNRPPAGFQTTGEVIDIKPAGPPNEFIVSVLCEGILIRVPSAASDAAVLQPGQKVAVISNSFNPVILPINQPG